MIPLFQFFTISIIFTTSLILSSCSSGDSSKDEESAPVLAITYAPPINIDNQSIYEIRGTCTGNEEGATVTVSVSTLQVGTPDCVDFKWQLSDLDVSTIDDSDQVFIVAREGEEEAQKAVVKDTGTDTEPPELAITHASPINLDNHSSYEIRGTCTRSGENARLTVNVGIFEVATVNCVDFEWEATGLDVERVTDDDEVAVVVREGEEEARQLVVKDTERPEVAITNAPAINGENQRAYTLSGTCSEDGQNVVVAAGSTSIEGHLFQAARGK